MSYLAVFNMARYHRWFPFKQVFTVTPAPWTRTDPYKESDNQEKTYRIAGKSLISDRVSIHDRPAEADSSRFGDWEMDLVIGCDQKSAVLTVVEKSVNMFLQTKLPSRKPEDVHGKNSSFHARKRSSTEELTNFALAS